MRTRSAAGVAVVGITVPGRLPRPCDIRVDLQVRASDADDVGAAGRIARVAAVGVLLRGVQRAAGVLGGVTTGEVEGLSERNCLLENGGGRFDKGVSGRDVRASTPAVGDDANGRIAGHGAQSVDELGIPRRRRQIEV